MWNKREVGGNFLKSDLKGVQSGLNERINVTNDCMHSSSNEMFVLLTKNIHFGGKFSKS